MESSYKYEITGISEAVNYVINTQHRDGNPNKCQWIIKETEEFRCFIEVPVSIFLHCNGAKKACYGLYVVNRKVEYLGVAAKEDANSGERLFIAKFVGDHGSQWHGYPANHTVRNQDIPNTEVRKYWLNNRILKKATVSKLSQGKKCKP